MPKKFIKLVCQISVLFYIPCKIYYISFIHGPPFLPPLHTHIYWEHMHRHYHWISMKVWRSIWFHSIVEFKSRCIIVFPYVQRVHVLERDTLCLSWLQLFYELLGRFICMLYSIWERFKALGSLIQSNYVVTIITWRSLSKYVFMPVNLPSYGYSWNLNLNLYHQINWCPYISSHSWSYFG